MAQSATGSVRMLLRIEGLILFAVATAGYFALSGHPWWLYFVLFLVPDLALIVFAVDRRTGAIVYDALHTTVGPLVLLALMFATSATLWGALAAIWLAHIGIDRAIGYGLRYPDTPDMTHLGPVGALKQAKSRDQASP